MDKQNILPVEETNAEVTIKYNCLIMHVFNQSHCIDHNYLLYNNYSIYNLYILFVSTFHLGLLFQTSHPPTSNCCSYL